jgi:hypothetical protein
MTETASYIITNHDKVKLGEAKRRMEGSPLLNKKGEKYDPFKKRGGMTLSRYRRMLSRGHKLYGLEQDTQEDQ